MRLDSATVFFGLSSAALNSRQEVSHSSLCDSFKSRLCHWALVLITSDIAICHFPLNFIVRFFFPSGLFGRFFFIVITFFFSSYPSHDTKHIPTPTLVLQAKPEVFSASSAWACAPLSSSHSSRRSAGWPGVNRWCRTRLWSQELGFRKDFLWLL